MSILICARLTVTALVCFIGIESAASVDSILGWGKSFECRRNVYSLGHDPAGWLILWRWAPNQKRFVEEPVSAQAVPPSPAFIERLDETHFAFVARAEADRASIWMLTFPADDSPVRAASGPAWSFPERITGFQHLHDDAFVVVGTASAAIIDQRGLECRRDFRDIEMEIYTSASHGNTLIVGPDTRSCSLACDSSGPTPRLGMAIRRVLSVRDGLMVILLARVNRQQALVALDDSFGLRWLSKIPADLSELGRTGAGVVAWEPDSSKAVLVDPLGSVLTLEIPRHRGRVDLINALDSQYVKFLTESGPIAAVRGPRIANERAVLLPRIRAWITFRQLLLISLTILGGAGLIATVLWKRTGAFKHLR